MVNRIRELLEARQFSPTQFADLIGVGRPVISHILSERNKPSLEVVQRVLDAFPDVSLSWLMKGIGPMLTGSAPALAAISPLSAVTPTVQAPTPEPIAAPPGAPTPAALPSLMLQPQAFTAVSADAASPVPFVAATLPTARPLPPKFRAGPAKAAEPASTFYLINASLPEVGVCCTY